MTHEDILGLVACTARNIPGRPAGFRLLQGRSWAPLTLQSSKLSAGEKHCIRVVTNQHQAGWKNVVKITNHLHRKAICMRSTQVKVARPFSGLQFSTGRSQQSRQGIPSRRRFGQSNTAMEAWETAGKARVGTSPSCVTQRPNISCCSLLTSSRVLRITARSPTLVFYPPFDEKIVLNRLSEVGESL